MVGGKNERVGGGGSSDEKKKMQRDEKRKDGRRGCNEKKKLEVVFSAECTSVINTSTMPG